MVKAADDRPMAVSIDGANLLRAGLQVTDQVSSTSTNRVSQALV